MAAAPVLPPEIPTIHASAGNCIAQTANLGGIGRARIVAFTAPISGIRACATVAVLNPGTYATTLRDPSAAIDGAPIVTADADSGGKDSVNLAGTTLTGAWVVAPGGSFPDGVVNDNSVASRVVIVFAGQQTLLVAVSPVSLVDLTRIFRDQPDLFGADSVERALVIASRTTNAPIATLTTDAGTFSEAEPSASASAQTAAGAQTLVIRKL